MLFEDYEISTDDWIALELPLTEEKESVELMEFSYYSYLFSALYAATSYQNPELYEDVDFTPLLNERESPYDTDYGEIFPDDFRMEQIQRLMSSNIPASLSRNWPFFTSGQLPTPYLRSVYTESPSEAEIHGRAGELLPPYVPSIIGEEYQEEPIIVEVQEEDEPSIPEVPEDGTVFRVRSNKIDLTRSIRMLRGIVRPPC